MNKFIDGLGGFLENLSHKRDEALYLFIKPYWPRKITPNHLTWLRIAIGLLLFVLLFFFHAENKILIISLFCVGLLTDLFDGSVARGLDKVTQFGAMLDPVADRVIILPIALYSLYEHWGLLIVWVLTEIVNASTSLFYKSKKPYTESNIFGKTKMVLWAIVFLALLILWPNPLPIIFIDILWISLIISILSIFTKVSNLKNEGHITNKILTKKL